MIVVTKVVKRVKAGTDRMKKRMRHPNLLYVLLNYTSPMLSIPCRWTNVHLPLRQSS
jgi:hypothetical protein